jgi:hypothetical protein
MIPVKARVNPPCRQCGHAFDEPAAHCPVCGTRTGMPVPLQAPLRRTIDEPSHDGVLIEADEFDESALDDVVLEPPLERPPEPIDLEAYIAEQKEAEIVEAAAPVARRVTLGSLMIGTLLIAVCLGLARASTFAGIVAFLVIVPAYIRTLSAVSFYRDAGRQIDRGELMGIFATSLILAFVGLAAGGVAFLAMTFLGGLIAGLFDTGDPVMVSTILGTAAAFVIIVLLLHKVWPVNQV